MAGIACAGNWILDRVKIVDRWPRKGELANIQGEILGPGGSPFNILVDFKRMGAPFPAFGFGCIGDDDNGRQILSMCGQYGIDGSHLQMLPDIATSYTEVMSVQKTGERTFFHFRGANARFSPEHVPLEVLQDKGVKILHLAYLLLLDAMDAPDADFGTVAARFLSEVQNSGMETSVDLVSDAAARFKKIAGPALPYIDHLILNELEAERITLLDGQGRHGTVRPLPENTRGALCGRHGRGRRPVRGRAFWPARRLAGRGGP
jgi:sugar/nucleoside kinase (ribokinase family)